MYVTAAQVYTKKETRAISWVGRWSVDLTMFNNKKRKLRWQRRRCCDGHLSIRLSNSFMPMPFDRGWPVITRPTPIHLIINGDRAG